MLLRSVGESPPSACGIPVVLVLLPLKSLSSLRVMSLKLRLNASTRLLTPVLARDEFFVGEDESYLCFLPYFFEEGPFRKDLTREPVHVSSLRESRSITF